MADHDTHDHTGVTGVPSSTAPNPTTIELGHASDTTLSRVSAGVVAVEGTNIVKAGATTTSGLTMATARLLGRTTASSGAIEEITVGTGLSLSAGSLTASGSSAPIASGTSNPGSPANNDLFYRTDLDLLIFYDGTRWLTLNLYGANIGPMLTISAINSGVRFRPMNSGLDMWLVALDLAVGVFGTNTGANFWTYTLDKRAVGDVATTIITKTTAAVTASNWTTVNDAIGASVAVGTHFNFIIQASVKTGTPGNLLVLGGFTYRLIVT